MPTPNAEQFARVLLWHLCGLRVEIASLKAEIDGLKHDLGKSPDQTNVKESIQADYETQLKLYQDGCKDAGLSTAPPTESSGAGIFGN